jgi:AcrR family transcriptional regulator
VGKRTTQDRLAEAAFALFEERGYDAATVDAIAERAGVGRTTFFRAFAAKEDVIFPDHDDVLGQVQARLATASQETSLVALSEAARLVLLHYLGEGDLARSRYRLTSSVSALRDRELTSRRQYQRVFRDFLRQWTAGEWRAELRADLLAAAVVTAHNHVLRRWLRGLATEPEAELDLAMAEVISLYADPLDRTAAAAASGTSVFVVQTSGDLEDVVARVRAALAL